MSSRLDRIASPEGYEIFCTSSSFHFFLPLHLANDLKSIQYQVMKGMDDDDEPDEAAVSADHEILVESVRRHRQRDKPQRMTVDLDPKKIAAERLKADVENSLIRHESLLNPAISPKPQELVGPPRPPELEFSYEDAQRAGSYRTFPQMLKLLTSAMSDHAYYNKPRPGESRVFKSQTAVMACERMGRDRERFSAFSEMLLRMAKNNGYRKLIHIDSKIESELIRLKSRFLNFSHVIDRIANQIMVWPYCREDQRRLTPILLEGPPGVGKSYFCEELAKVLGIPYKRIDCAAVTGAMALTGSTSHWGNAQPGIILETAVNSDSANNMWFLDEINHASQESKSPVMPVLLGMLEPQTAQYLRDDYCGIEFDVSRNIFIAACNDTRSMPSALISRFESFTIASPNSQQRKIVAKRLFEQTFIAFDIDDEALNLVARLDLGLRELRRVMTQCGERLVMELRRIGHDTPSSGADRPVVRELHVREIIRANRYRLLPVAEVEFDRA